MSTTPNQKDLLAKKSDLEGILKPDDNDVLHLPDVTITLAESGQFYLAGIDKKLLTLVGNTSGNAVTLDGDAGLTFTTSGGSSTITGITSSSGNSTSLAASQSMASAKQDKIIAGTNITIAQDGKTISATDTTYSTFNGASASADGSTGLVPKPFIADKDKYLRGDGTWQTIQATPALNDLTDVDLTTPTDGQILKYDAINQEWINANENPGVTELSGLTDVDVTTTTPTNGQGLVYNSTSKKWENGTVSSASSIDTLTDVNLTNLTNGQILKYNSTSQEWENANESGGGSGDSFITYSKSVTTTQYGWWIVEDENGNTLDPDTYVIIDISVNVRYYDVLWYQEDSTGDYRATLFDINDGNTIRSSSTLTWTITYAKKDFSSGGGGSSVIPNPTDPATDTLSSIEIDGTVYSIEGGEGYTEEVIYSATSTTAAPSTLTLTKPYTDFDMLLFNLYRSADGVMNKYDRVVLTSKLSLNDRIQLITYNEWASYDITTTTSFTLINENRMYIGSVVGLKFGQGSGGGGSSEVTYSTTEHKIGTWIDGSDVYEKTIILRENGVDNYTYLGSVFSQCLPANINWINIESFYAKRGSGGWVDCMNNQQETILVPNPTTQGIYFYSQMSHTDIIVTIRYTKTI